MCLSDSKVMLIGIGVRRILISSREMLKMYDFSGLDSRYMISRLRPPGVNVLSLTTIATPHHGSAFADYMFDRIGRKRSFVRQNISNT